MYSLSTVIQVAHEYRLGFRTGTVCTSPTCGMEGRVTLVPEAITIVKCWTPWAIARFFQVPLLPRLGVTNPYVSNNSFCKLKAD